LPEHGNLRSFYVRRRSARTWQRLAAAALVANVIACGTRTELFDGPLFDTDDDVADADTARDASDRSDARANFDASAALDSGVRRHHHDAGVIDSGVDAAIDAAPPSCTATSPTMLATATYDLDQITVDDAHVFFHDHNGISRVSKTGSDATLLASMQVLW
jgi:hypothetical protein